MSISDIYLSGDHKRNISHFANIVKIAKADDIIMKDEELFLKKIAKTYNIEEDRYKEIFKNPEKYPIKAHLSNEERIERLYDLVKMVFADNSTSMNEVSLLRAITTGLAFPIKRVDTIVERALQMDIKTVKLEDFHKEIMKP